MPATKLDSASSPLDLRYYQFHLSLRYLRSRFSSFAALLSITFGVAVILILLAIMGGYVEDLREHIRGQESHLILVGRGRYSITGVDRIEALVQSVDNVKDTAPFIDALGMYRSTSFSPCQLKGIDPMKQPLVSDLGEYVFRPDELETVLTQVGDDAGPGKATEAGVIGKIEAVLGAPNRAAVSPEELAAFFEPEFNAALLERENPVVLRSLQGEIPDGVLVGAHLLLEKELFLGQVITVVTASARADRKEPVTRPFVVAGAFKTGDFEADSRVIFLHIDTLKNILGLFDEVANDYAYEGVRVAVDDLSRLDETQEKIEEALATTPQRIGVLRWEDLRRNLLRAVEIEKFIVFFLLVVVQSFSGFMVLLMLTLIVIDKTRDMGVLLALGATRQGITKVFLANGLALTIVGTVLGLGLGYLFCAYINPVHDWIYAQTGVRLFDPRIYNMDRIPIAIRLRDVLLSVVTPLTFGFLASIAPAVWAARRDPIKAIHYE